MSYKDIKIRNVFIPCNEKTYKLYELEKQRNEIISKCAVEQGKLLGCSSHWNEAIPTQLFDILGSYRTFASIKAAITYLRVMNNMGRLPPKAMEEIKELAKEV